MLQSNLFSNIKNIIEPHSDRRELKRHLCLSFLATIYVITTLFVSLFLIKPMLYGTIMEIPSYLSHLKFSDKI